MRNGALLCLPVSPALVSVEPDVDVAEGLFYLGALNDRRTGILYLNGSMASAINYEDLPADAGTGDNGAIGVI